MQQIQQEQIMTLLQNIEESRKTIPSFQDLLEHPIFGAALQELSEKDQKETKKLIDLYIEQKIESLGKTKGGQLFQRFFEAYNELFWKFRRLNESDVDAESKAFQEVGKEVEQELFKLEGILTEKMLNQEKGLDKVIDSFYNIVYLFFPRYNMID
ncbi:MAG: hypothetical protein PHU61_01380 [Candidatus Absconditabacteria bacterium]|nr:hypothetical protein [Candidatus Absconditabacteria bacterium]MDD3868048.1 hypothetical protein [Candidatus Absconditabacteria bacterium]MDD4714295.1 hypothetical protein [Candidatus Absconditabacteria bacterium]